MIDEDDGFTEPVELKDTLDELGRSGKVDELGKTLDIEDWADPDEGLITEVTYTLVAELLAEPDDAIDDKSSSFLLDVNTDDGDADEDTIDVAEVISDCGELDDRTGATTVGTKVDDELPMIGL